MRNSTLNHFNNYFHKNKLNLFKIGEGTKEIVKISKKGKTDITSTVFEIRTFHLVGYFSGNPEELLNQNKTSKN